MNIYDNDFDYKMVFNYKDLSQKDLQFIANVTYVNLRKTLNDLECLLTSNCEFHIPITDLIELSFKDKNISIVLGCEVISEVDCIYNVNHLSKLGKHLLIDSYLLILAKYDYIVKTIYRRNKF